MNEVQRQVEPRELKGFGKEHRFWIPSTLQHYKLQKVLKISCKSRDW
jgi:hypothetical protein